MLGEAIAYLTKYMEKTGEKMVYSKGLPQFFISDIMDEDIVCPIGKEDKKLLLYDGRGLLHGTSQQRRHRANAQM